jgi:hypothetical protein
VGVTQRDSSAAVSEEHFLVDELGLIARRIGHESNFTGIADEARSGEAGLAGKEINHEGNLAASRSVIRESIDIEMIARCKGENKSLPLAPLRQIVRN